MLKLFNKRDTILLDTSVLIDGRIVGIAKSGMLGSTLIVPSFVLEELQLLADKGDSSKRERARVGLLSVDLLRREPDVDISVYGSKTKLHNADDQILKLSITKKWRLMTLDYNLQSRAIAENVKVADMNKLVQNLRPVVLPGEYIDVKIVQRGENVNQGVGYLEDGTMIVVDNASRLKGRTIKVVVDRTIQTASGKMFFAHKA
jgi:uncharacterized protein YacL